MPSVSEAMAQQGDTLQVAGAGAVPVAVPDTLAPVEGVPAALKPRPREATGDSLRMLRADIFDHQDSLTSILSGDTLFVDKGSAWRGVAGDPVPYTVAGDNFVTSILIACFLLAMLAFAQSHHFIIRQAKSFFSPPRRQFSDITETTGELRFQAFLVLQTCLLLGLFYFFFTRSREPLLADIPQYAQIGIYTAIIAACLVLKMMLYALVGWTFFDSQKNGQWMKAFLFLMATEGILLFPAAMLASYFNISLESTFIYTFAVLVLIKMLTLYKTTLIFFPPNHFRLQNILYFCTLEVVPAMALWGCLAFANEYLRIII